MTSDPDVEAEALGLTSLTLACNRMEYVYRIGRAAPAVPWLGSVHRERAAERARTGGHGWALPVFEGPYQRPDLWWVSDVPVMGTLVRVRPDVNVGLAP
jgi:hypothetical protein